MFMADSVGYRDDNITDREYNKLPTYFEALTTTSYFGAKYTKRCFIRIYEWYSSIFNKRYKNHHIRRTFAWWLFGTMVKLLKKLYNKGV